MMTTIAKEKYANLFTSELLTPVGNLQYFHLLKLFLVMMLRKQHIQDTNITRG